MKTKVKNLWNFINLPGLLVIFCAFMLILTVRGLPGNPNAIMLNQSNWRDNGPFELSPERGRYALLYSIVEDHSLKFSASLARFVVPDVGYINNHYASLFAPSVSFISMPGYIIGRYFGVAQVGSFLVIAIFALLNLVFIRAISIRAGASPAAASITGLVFLFATPAFTYASTLYQHHISTFLILASIFLLLRGRSFISLFLIWMIIAFSITVDNPNFFMMLPIGVVAAFRILSFEKAGHAIKINLPLLRITTIFGVILPVVFFLWFNYASYGNPWQLPGTIQRTPVIDYKGKPVFPKTVNTKTPSPSGRDTTNEVALAYFKNNNIVGGMYTFFVSQDRGMIVYTPVILLGFVGFILTLKRKNPHAPLLFAVLAFNLIIYSMWGDPYGGWAFGARYLIPGYAILSIFIALLLDIWGRKKLFLLFFFVVLCYSIFVNALGALTSSKNPPKSEAIALERQYHIPEPYTYERNIILLNNNISNSYVYSSYARSYLNAWEYYTSIVSLIIIFACILMIRFWRTNN